MYIGILSVIGLLSAILAIIYKQHGSRLYVVFKPLTTIIILLIASVIYLRLRSNYSGILIIGLIFCLIGDILLLKRKYSLYGLSSFLIAHIVFMLAFSSLYGFSRNIFPLIILLLIMALFFAYLKRDLHKYLIPVIIYSFALLMMNWQATGLLYTNKSLSSYAIGAASLLFLFSDSVLAYNKFKKTFKNAEIIILSTYWVAIYIFTIAGIK